MPVTEDAELTWIPYLHATTKAKSKTTLIATVFLPVNDQKEAESIVQAITIMQLNPDQIEVTVRHQGQSFKWTFEKRKDGFVLKD